MIPEVLLPETCEPEMNVTACVGCGGRFPEMEGPTHRYLESSPACWACFGEVLNRESGDIRFDRVHRLTVDAYALQHPGRPSPQTICSVALHSISLCAIFEEGCEPSRATRVIQQAARTKQRFEWLSPPNCLGALTIADVFQAEDTDAHLRLVRRWAESVWLSWADHHATIRQWLLRSWDT